MPIAVHEHVGNSAYRTKRRSGQGEGNRYNGDEHNEKHTHTRTQKKQTVFSEGGDIFLGVTMRATGCRIKETVPCQ